MTDIDALRDRLAVLCGWEKFYRMIGGGTWNPPGDKSRIFRHPFPPNDYNALIAAWPERAKITIEYTCWDGRPNDRVWVASSDSRSYVGDTEYQARLRLTVAVLEAAKAGHA